MEFSKLNGYLVKDKKAIRFYNNVDDMKNDTTLKDGMCIKTKGYYNINDGGSAMYNITTSTSENEHQETLKNGLYATLIVENNRINIKQLGATEKNDISQYVRKYLLINNGRINLYIPSGLWYCSETVLDSWFSITGDSKFVGKTEIYPNTANQQFIFRLENITNWNMEYLHFETGANKGVSNAIIKMYRACYGNMGYLTFQNVIGQCIDLERSFEINFLTMIARHIIPIVLGENYGVIKVTSSNDETPSTIYFDYIQLERIEGNVFVFNNSSAFYNNHIGCINIEEKDILSTIEQDTMVSELKFKPITSELPSNLKHFAIFKLLDNSDVNCLSIDSIDTNNMASCIFSYGDNNYIFDTLFYKTGDESTNKTLGVNLNNISFLGLKQNFQLLNVRDGNPNIVNYSNVININNINYEGTSTFYAYFNCKGENNINCCNINNPKNNNVVPSDVIECCKIAKGIGSNNFGFLTYDPDSISSLKLTVYPFGTHDENAYFKVIGTSKNLLIRYRSENTTNIVIYDEERNTSKYFLVNPTNNYIYQTLNLTELQDYVIGDTLRIGLSGGYSVKFDIMKFI